MLNTRSCCLWGLSVIFSFLVLLHPDGDGLPLTQPQPSHGSCPGTPEMRRRQEEAMRRLASQVVFVPHLLNSNAGGRKKVDLQLC